MAFVQGRRDLHFTNPDYWKETPLYKIKKALKTTRFQGFFSNARLNYALPILWKNASFSIRKYVLVNIYA